MRLFLTRPTHVLHLLWLVCVAICTTAAWFATSQPWLGVSLEASKGSEITISGVTPALAQTIPAGAVALRLSSPSGASLDLRSTDLIEEPDFFDTYPEMADFFARQNILYGMLQSPEVELTWRMPDGEENRTAIRPTQRPLSSLPLVFWFQLFTGCAGLIIAGWVFLLRPGDWSARMFALTGVMFPFATTTAAIYSTRELALPGELLRVLSSLNHVGSILFGGALVGLFLSYPRLLVKPRMLLWLPVIFGTWLAADIFRLAPDQDWGSRFPVMTEMLLAILFAAIQWRRSRGQPLDRAALRWFILSSVVGCSLFIAAIPAASALGYFQPLSQGYSFGFFLIMYAGIALGLRRYRLFDLDEWAYRVFLWVTGAVVVIAMDTLLIFFGMGQAASLGVTLLVCGWLYFPFRQWLWQRLANSNTAKFEALLPELSGIAFLSSQTEREHRWNDLLQRMFDPLEMSKCADDGTEAHFRGDGLELYVPACGGFGPRLLRYAGRGERLFSSRDIGFADSLCRLMGQIMSGRDGYERGVEQERKRIAQDLHDNIGARILKLIHHLRGSPGADIARDAMKDLRTAIAAIDAPPVPLSNALADWRAETGSRCEAAGTRMEWQQDDGLPELELQPRVKATLESVLREAVTNALKHAAPDLLAVRVTHGGDAVRICVENDCARPNPAGWREGYGLRNMRGRLKGLGGTLEIAGADSGTRLSMEIPLGALT